MDFAHVFFRHFLKTEYLHFGYWEPNLNVNFLNLYAAQHLYVEKLFSMIPQDTKTILDVGCGSGKMASELIAKDYLVDALSPPSIMTNIAKKRLSGKSDFYEMRFEELETDKRYDLVIFSESYQFVNLR